MKNPTAYLGVHARQLEQRPDVVSARVLESRWDPRPAGTLLGWTFLVCFRGDIWGSPIAIMERHTLLCSVVFGVENLFGFPQPPVPWLQDNGCTASLFWPNPDNQWP